ncbi:MAG: hypothetical protein K0B06_13535 [Brevefilum sp.]|nr:hypothetical protein [Brevefilum sp.]
MRKQAMRFTILSCVLLLSLSGCFSYRFEVQHNPDGSGQLTIESILSQDFLNMFSGSPDLEETHDDILAESIFTEDDLRDDPNIRAVSEETFTDPVTGDLHHILEIEIIDIQKPLYLDQEEGDDSIIFEVVDNGDGTFLFTATLETPSDFAAGNDEMDDVMPMDPGSLRFFLQDSTITWQLSADELIEADPVAKFDPVNKIITWQIPLTDVLFAAENLDIFAVYRTHGSQAALEPEPAETLTPTLEPEPEDTATPTLAPTSTESPIQPTVDLDFKQPRRGFLGLPNWVPLVLAGALCLGVIVVAIAAVVIFLVTRNKKQDPPPDNRTD